MTHIELDALFRRACERASIIPILLDSDARAGGGAAPESREGKEAAARAAAWHSARHSAMQALAQALAVAESAAPRVVLVDDTSEHRSWRRSIAATARDHRAALLVLELVLPASVASARNAARPLGEQVPRESMRRVTLQLQRTTASVLRGSSGRGGRGAAAWESAFLARVPAEGSPAEVLALARAALEGAWGNTLPARADGGEEPRGSPSAPAGAPGRGSRHRSEVHACDLRLRDAVSACMGSVSAARRGSAAAAASAGAGGDSDGARLGAELAAVMLAAEPPVTQASAGALLRAAKVRALDAARAAAAAEAPSSSDADAVWTAARDAMLAALEPAASCSGT